MSKYKITIENCFLFIFLFYIYIHIYTYKTSNIRYSTSSNIMCNQEEIAVPETITPTPTIPPPTTVCVSYESEPGCCGGCGDSITRITPSSSHSECPCDDSIEIGHGQFILVSSVTDGGTPCCSGYMPDYTFQVFDTEAEANSARAELKSRDKDSWMHYNYNVLSFSDLQEMDNVN